MLKQLKEFIGRRPPPPPRRQSDPPCKHAYCAHLTYCLKSIGEDTFSLSGITEVHSINTVISDYFDPTFGTDYRWDSEDGWGEFCYRCRNERCQDCGTGMFTSVTHFEDVLTFETRELGICSPCRHGLCPRFKLRIVSLCGVCGHVACAECMTGGTLSKGPDCCTCRHEQCSLELSCLQKSTTADEQEEPVTT